MSGKECRKHEFYYAKCATCREDDAVRRTRTCRHFNGIQNAECREGITYRALVGGNDFGWARRIPCLSEADAVVCGKFDPPTLDEARAEQAEQDAHVADIVARLDRGEEVEGVIVCRKKDMEPWV